MIFPSALAIAWSLLKLRSTGFAERIALIAGSAAWRARYGVSLSRVSSTASWSLIPSTWVIHHVSGSHFSGRGHGATPGWETMTLIPFTSQAKWLWRRCGSLGSGFQFKFFIASAFAWLGCWDAQRRRHRISCGLLHSLE